MRDDLAIHNERVKLRAATFNALAIGLIGLAILRPLVEPDAALGVATAWWLLPGLAGHGIAHYLLGSIRRADP